MDGHQNQNHGPGAFLQDEVTYDDLINNAGWPAAPDQQQFSFPQQQNQDHGHYPRFQSSQPAYDHFDLPQQPSYNQLSYSNSPYATQFQNSRSSDTFGGDSFSVDPSLQTPQNYQSINGSFPYTSNAMENATIAPQSLYTMPQPQTLSRAVSTSAYQGPSGGMVRSYIQGSQEQQPLYFNDQRNGNMHLGGSNSIQYTPLSHVTSDILPKQVQAPKSSGDAAPQIQRVQQQAQLVSPPQNPLRITHPELYSNKNTSTRPRFDYAPFIAWEDTPIQVTLGLKTTLPKYQPRKSKSGKDPIPGFDVSKSLTPSQISVKKRGRPRKEPGAPTSKYTSKAAGQKTKATSARVNNLREDGLNSSRSPSLQESSSEETDSTSESESEYEEDEMPVVDIKHVRSPTRPTGIPEATRWDTIGILWKDPYSSPHADIIKDAIEKYGNFFSALRAQLKTNATKIEEAASRPAELTKYRDERRVLLEALFQSIDAANNQGFEAIIENLGGHHKLVLGLTSTLVDCVKANDFEGKLPKAVFKLLAKFKTLTDELLKKVKFDGLQKRWMKRGDAETKNLITSIVANTTDAKERAVLSKKIADEKKIREQFEQNRKRQLESAIMAGLSSSPGKRPHEGDGTNGKPSKKFASDVAGVPAALAKTVPVKRPVGNLLGISSKPAPKAVVKKRDASPPRESRLGAILADIAKPPEKPKAPDAPARAPETPEEKVRRERKESRRHLRVKFKEEQDLVEVRYFKHEQAEDEGRQDEMLRDAHSDRLEGMMHKKRVSESNDDDDEDYQPPDFDTPYVEPVKIDFSSVEKITRFGQAYTTRGGDLEVHTAEQKKQEHREGIELMVVYTDANDIPPSPKEPSQTDIADFKSEPHHLKASTQPWLNQRVQEIYQYGPENAFRLLVSRREEQMFKEVRENRARGVAQYLSKQSVSSSQLQASGGDPQSLSTQQKPLQMDPIELAKLLATVASLKGLPYPPEHPPAWMNAAQKDEWYEGYYRDNPQKKKERDDQLQAQMNALQYQQPTQIVAAQYQQPPPQAHMAYQTPIPQSYTQAPTMPQQVHSYLANLYQNGASQAAPQPSQAFDYNAWAAQQAAVAAAAAASSSQNQNQSHQQRWDNNDRENEATNNNNRGGKGKQRYEGKNPTDSLFDENGDYKGKKKPCKFYWEGKCAKGAKCTFLHE